jgi:hypothetical protein
MPESSMLLTDRPLCECAVAGRRAERLALQARCFGADTPAFAAYDGKRRSIVDHHHGLDVGIGIFVAEPDERIHIAEPHIMCSRGYPRDRLA